MDDSQVMSTLSDNLRKLKDLRGLSINVFAELCGLSASTFKKHLYCENLIPLNTLILICNTHKASINTMFEGLLSAETEQAFINRTTYSLKSVSEEKRFQIVTTLTPFTESVINSYPRLENAKCGTRLRILRHEIAYSPEQVSELCNIELSTLKNYESSDILPSVPTFLSLCGFYRVSPEYLLCNSVLQLLQNDWFYKFTPSQLAGLATTMEKLCATFR